MCKTRHWNTAETWQDSRHQAQTSTRKAEFLTYGWLPSLCLMSCKLHTFRCKQCYSRNFDTSELHGVESPFKAYSCSTGQELPAFWRIRRFNTVTTIHRPLDLILNSPIQSTPSEAYLTPHFHLRRGFPSRLFPSGFPNLILYQPKFRQIPFNQ